MSDTPNPSLQKKSAARLSAVQCLYTAAINGKAMDADKQIAALKDQVQHNQGEQKLRFGVAFEPDYKLMQALLAGVSERGEDIDARLALGLSANWKRERMSPLLIAILQCAIFELFFHKDGKPGILIDEYTRLTRKFFDDDDVHFVHAALRNLVARYAPPAGDG